MIYWPKVACGCLPSVESGLRPCRLASKRRDFCSLGGQPSRCLYMQHVGCGG
jgi:hypothetical protein